MKLKTKIRILFLISLLIFLPIVYFGLPAILMNVATKQMEKQSKTFGLYLLKNIEYVTSIYEDETLEKIPDNEQKEFEDMVYKEFEKSIQIAKDSESFIVNEIILIKPDYKVEVGYPVEQKGLDYSTHKDIVENFKNKEFKIVLENNFENGIEKLDIDIVSFLKVQIKDPRVLEIKLDFQKSMAMLNQQYRIIKLISVAIALLIFIIIMFIILYIIRKTIIDPAIKISSAMENVGKGDLGQRVDYKSNDELGLMARRFNEMVNGLNEKLQLSRYVSQSTMDAVKTAVINGKNFHTPQRKKVAVFFSDIRGFTNYSEKKDPAYIINMLNRVLGTQAKVIKKYGGDIDKFAGDEVMAVFDSAEKAIMASLEIQRIMDKFKDKLDNLKLGIGIVEGDVVQGDVGSEDIKNFTIIGDNVNTAARLQTNASGGEIIVSELLTNKSGFKNKFNFEFKGKIKLKGKEEEMNLYRVLGSLKN